MSYSQQVAEASPTVTVTGLSLFGVPLSEVLIALTVVYTLIIIWINIKRLIDSYRQPSDDPQCAANCPAVKRAREQEGKP